MAERDEHVARPRRWWRWLALVPVIAMLLAPFVANRTEPRLFGLPFLLAYIVIWAVLAPLVTALMYRLDAREGHRS